MVVGVYDNSGINTLIGYPLNISLELSPSSSFTGINSGLISTTNGSITFKNLRIISSGTFKFIAKGLDLISGSSSDIVINAFSVDSIKLKASVSVISAYFSFTLSVYLFNQIGSAHQVSETVYLTANIGFGGNEATSTSLGIGNFSVYGKALENKQPFVLLSDSEPKYLLIGRCEQETIFAFTSTFQEMFSVLKPGFDMQKLKDCMKILISMLSYHTLDLNEFSPKTVMPKLRDLDSMTKTQTAVVDFLVAVDGLNDHVEFNIQIAQYYADLTLMPFIPFYCDFDTKDPCYIKQGLRKQTYVAMACKSYELLSIKLDQTESRLRLYNDGMIYVLRALSIPIKYRYSCPDKGAVNDTPLWKQSTAVLWRLVTLTITDLGVSIVEQHKETMESIIKEIGSSFESFFFYDWLFD